MILFEWISFRGPLGQFVLYASSKLVADVIDPDLRGDQKGFTLCGMKAWV